MKKSMAKREIDKYYKYLTEMHPEKLDKWRKKMDENLKKDFDDNAPLWEADEVREINKVKAGYAKYLKRRH